MKFKIQRTRGLGNPEIKGAIVEEYIHIDRRSVSSLEEARRLPWYEDWYKKGVHHREENGMIACDVIAEPFYRYVIDIDDLMEWLEELDCQIVLSPKSHDDATDPLPEIEIYDSFRE